MLSSISAEVGGGGGGGGGGGLWGSILRDAVSSKRSRLPEGSIHVFGSEGCGKSSLTMHLSSASSSSSLSSTSSLNSTLMRGSNAQDSRRVIDPVSRGRPLVGLGGGGGTEVQIDNTDVVDYKYFELDESASKYVSSSSDNLSNKIHVWTYNTKALGTNISLIKEIDFSEKNIFLVCIDLSDHENCMNSLKLWIQFLMMKFKEAEDKEKAFLNSNSASQNNPTKSNYSTSNNLNPALTCKLNQFVYKSDPKRYLNSSGSGSDGSRFESGIGAKTGHPVLESGSVSVWKTHEQEVLRTFPFHVIVVGCKADKADTNNYQALQAAKILQGKIRAICLHIGASFVSTSSYRNANIDTLRQYMQHCLYPDLIPGCFELIEDSIETAFFPLGFDSDKLINLSTGMDSSNIDDIIKDFVLSISSDLACYGSNNQNIKSNLPIVPQVELESEAEWLATLQSSFNKHMSTRSGGLVASSMHTPVLSTGSSLDIKSLVSTIGYKGTTPSINNPSSSLYPPQSSLSNPSIPTTSVSPANSVFNANPPTSSTSSAPVVSSNANLSSSTISPVASIMASINASRSGRRQSSNDSSQLSSSQGNNISVESSEPNLNSISNQSSTNLAGSRMTINSLSSSTSSNNSDTGGLAGSVSRLSLGGSGSATVNSIADSLANSSGSRRTSLGSSVSATPTIASIPGTSVVGEKQQSKEEVDDFFKTLLAGKKK